MSGSVRRALAGDEAVVRDVRLRALADAPGAFSSTRAREATRTADEWRGWLTRRAVFLFERAGGPGGIAAGEPHGSDEAGAFLVSMWVEPVLRGSGAADALIAAVVNWARERGASALWLHVTASEERARRCYERNGFRATGVEFVRERDGARELEMRLML